MNFSKKQVKDASEKAKKLVNDVDKEYKQTTYSVMFTKLLTDSKLGMKKNQLERLRKKEK